MTLPSADTPLYNHPLPEIEQWLKSQGCEQDTKFLHSWRLNQADWQAQLWLEAEELTVVYIGEGENGQDIKRSFKYSLSREDIEAAVFSGP